MQYSLKVLGTGQQVTLLTLDAANTDEAVRQAQQQGNVVLSVKRQTSIGIPSLASRTTGFPLILFSQELLSLLDAGLSLMEAMETLREKEYRPTTRRVLDQVMALLNEGLPLSQALENSQGLFPPLYIALIRSSEKTGDLVEALTRFVTYQSQVDMVRKKMISASIYPALLIIVGALVVLFLLLYVVPKFSAIYESQSNNLPWMSQLLLAWGRMLHNHALTVLSTAVGFVALLVYGLTRPAIRSRLVDALWRIPAIGERMRVYQLARLYRTLGMLLRGGIPVVTAMGMVDGLLRPNLRERLQLAAQDIREGRPLSNVMELRNLTTPVAVRMLRVGERSGHMGEMMERIGNFYDDEIARWVDWFTRLFEPILMTGIGLVVGVVVVLMYMPITATSPPSAT
jgi:general secretion pathway protein F